MTEVTTLGELMDLIGDYRDLRFLTVTRGRVSELFVKREFPEIDVDLIYSRVGRYEVEIADIGCYAHLKVWLI